LTLQNLEQLERELQEGVFRPVYVILGPEDYLCRQAIDLLKRSLIRPDALAFDYAEFVADETPVDQIIEAVNTFPMISKRRLVLVNQLEKLRDPEQESIIDSIATLSSRSTLILFGSDLDRRKKFFRVLRDTCCVAEFPTLKGPALERWASAFVKQRGHRISSASIKKIVDLAGSDLQSLAMELEKLLLYAGDMQNVPDSAVNDLVRESRQQSIFELIDAVARRDRSGALKSLSNLMRMGEHPLVVVTMLARHCRQVIIAQECLQQRVPTSEIGTAAQIPHFRLDQFLREARAADPGSIRQMLIKLAEIDRRLKSSAADGRMLLENLICALV
jgi:DNA polymerase-3 subunit delta